jgi:hypothetical protein
MQVTEANYPAFKSGLESLGFSGLPAATAVNWTQANPFSANATIVYKTLQPTTQTIQLAPAG